MPNKVSIGSKIKQIRQEKNMSQEFVVERLSELDVIMSRETLSKIETNKRSISAIELDALCNIFSVDISEFFEEEDDDLVTLFRKKRDLSEETLKELENLEDLIKMAIGQKEIFYGQFKVNKRTPLWKDCWLWKI